MELEEIIKFWFGKNIEVDPLQNMDKWFTKNPVFDAIVSDRFKPSLQKLDELSAWKESPKGSMAYILLTDQFPRNIFRNQKTSFSFDSLALEEAKNGIQDGFDQELSWIERCFYYLPFEHSENLEMQEESLKQFQALQRFVPKAFADYGDEVYDYAVKHWEMIKRFGRFPHRNKILKRESTPEEIEFLKQPGSSF